MEDDKKSVPVVETTGTETTHKTSTPLDEITGLLEETDLDVESYNVLGLSDLEDANDNNPDSMSFDNNKHDADVVDKVGDDSGDHGEDVGDDVGDDVGGDEDGAGGDGTSTRIVDTLTKGILNDDNNTNSTMDDAANINENEPISNTTKYASMQITNSNEMIDSAVMVMTAGCSKSGVDNNLSFQCTGNNYNGDLSNQIVLPDNPPIKNFPE